MDDKHVAYEKLVAFAADELVGAEAKGIAVHIAICAECSRTAARFKTISVLMRTDDSQEPPPATIARAQAISARHRSALVWKRINSLWSLASFRRFSMAAMLVLLVLSNILTYAGISQIAVASQDAIPGDSLYPTKLAIEGIQLAASWDTESRLEKHIDFAGFRLNELGALVAIDRLAEIPNTLAAFENEVDQVSVTFKVLVKENYQRAKALGPKVEAALSQYSTTLGDLRGIAAGAVRPALENAITVCNTSRSTVNTLYLQSPTVVPSLAPLPTLTITPKPPAARSATPAQTRVMAPVASSTPAVAPANTVIPTTIKIPTVVPANTVIPTTTKIPTVAPSNTLRPTAIPTLAPVSTPTPISPVATPTEFVPPGQLKKTLTPMAPSNQGGSGK